MPQAAKRINPNGGERSPMERLKMTIKPKWIGSTPRLIAVGTMRGAKTIIENAMSKNMPASNMIKLAMIRNMTLLVARLNNKTVV